MYNIYIIIKQFFFIFKIESNDIIQFNENNDRFGFKYFIENKFLKNTKNTMISVYIPIYRKKEKV